MGHHKRGKPKSKRGFAGCTWKSWKHESVKNGDAAQRRQELRGRQSEKEQKLDDSQA